MWSRTPQYLCLLMAMFAFNVNAEISAQTTEPSPSLEAGPIDVSLIVSPIDVSHVETNESNPLNTYQLALNYLLGRNGTEKSAEKAASLFKKLAEQNWSSAQHMLGNMYLRGKGVEKNDLLAYKWLSLASKNNLQLAQSIHDKRRQLYAKLQNNLSLQSLNKVETWITEWKPANNMSQVN